MSGKEQKKKEVTDIEIKEFLKNLPKPTCPICGTPLILSISVWGQIIGWCPIHGVVERK